MRYKIALFKTDEGRRGRTFNRGRIVRGSRVPTLVYEADASHREARPAGACEQSLQCALR